MSKSVADTLRAAKALIADESNWCQKTYAKNAAGEHCAGDDPDAVCRCSAGALHPFIDDSKAEDDLLLTRCISILDDAAFELKGGWASVISFNDNQTHPEVMEMWDRAIALAESKYPTPTT